MGSCAWVGLPAARLASCPSELVWKTAKQPLYRCHVNALIHSRIIWEGKDMCRSAVLNHTFTWHVRHHPTNIFVHDGMHISRTAKSICCTTSGFRLRCSPWLVTPFSNSTGIFHRWGTCSSSRLCSLEITNIHVEEMFGTDKIIEHGSATEWNMSQSDSGITNSSLFPLITTTSHLKLCTTPWVWSGSPFFKSFREEVGSNETRSCDVVISARGQHGCWCVRVRTRKVGDVDGARRGALVPWVYWCAVFRHVALPTLRCMQLVVKRWVAVVNVQFGSHFGGRVVALWRRRRVRAETLSERSQSALLVGTVPQTRRFLASTGRLSVFSSDAISSTPLNHSARGCKGSAEGEGAPPPKMVDVHHSCSRTPPLEQFVDVPYNGVLRVATG